LVSKNHIGRLTAAALVAGAFTVAGAGLASPALADDGTPPRPPAAQRNLGPGGPSGGGPQQGARIMPGVPRRPGLAVPNAYRPALQQPGPRPGRTAANTAQSQEAVRARGVISAAAEVLAVTPESVTAGQEQGQTLTQIAAAQGMSRDYFLSELVNQIEKDIDDGQRFGIPASAGLEVQLANLVEQPGLGLRGSEVSNLF
jgi:hypothetical protein